MRLGVGRGHRALAGAGSGGSCIPVLAPLLLGFPTLSELQFVHL